VAVMLAQAGPQSGADERLREVVTRSLMSWETLVEEEFTGTAHPDLLFAFPRVRTDLDGALGVFRMWKAEYRDTRVYIHQILVDGNRFAAEYQFATTNKASGKRTVMGTIAIGQLREGRIVLLKEYTDGRVADLQEQGKLPLEEGEEPFPWPRPE
jgi:ketosteroid isomerase-like protein